jgi:hypothetical protein
VVVETYKPFQAGEKKQKSKQQPPPPLTRKEDIFDKGGVPHTQ